MGRILLEKPDGVVPWMKGTGFRGCRNYLQRVLPPEQYTSFIDSLDDELRQIFTQQILPSAWYPLSAQHRFFEACRRLWPSAVEGNMRAMGAEIASADLRGIYKIFIKMASVDRTLRVLVSAWKNYFSEGYAEVVDAQPSLFTADIVDEYHHPLHYFVAAGYIGEAIKLAGGKDVHVDVLPQPAGERVRYVARWI